MILKIITPAGIQVECQTERVFLPGSAGCFEVLKNHAPLISTLEKGVVRYGDADGRMQEYAVMSGFVKVKENVIIVCCE